MTGINHRRNDSSFNEVGCAVMKIAHVWRIFIEESSLKINGRILEDIRSWPLFEDSLKIVLFPLVSVAFYIVCCRLQLAVVVWFEIGITDTSRWAYFYRTPSKHFKQSNRSAGFFVSWLWAQRTVSNQASRELWIGSRELFQTRAFNRAYPTWITAYWFVRNTSHFCLTLVTGKF